MPFALSAANLTDEAGMTETGNITASSDEIFAGAGKSHMEMPDPCVPPQDWKVNPAAFTYNGQVTTKVYINDIPVESGYLGAFVGDECRGIVEASYFPPQAHYVFELLCYSNEASGEIMSLRYLDAQNCKIFTLFTDSVEFIADMTLGNASSPFQLQYPATSSFDKSIASGWTWFSVNALAEDMALGNMLDCANDNDFIMSQALSATYYQEGGWHGSLEEAGGLDPLSLYKIKTADPCGISYVGIPVDPPSATIDLVPGWNWIGYLPPCIHPITAALNSLTLEDGDYIKNQTESATYYDGFGWFGSLEALSPGEGYMLRKTTADALSYPGCTAASQEEQKASTVDQAESEHSPNPHQFQYNGTVTARVYMDGTPAGSEEDLVMAFVDDELRGVMAGLYFQPMQSYVYPLMIYSNLADGDSISFKYYAEGQESWYLCDEKLVFSNDMVVADAFEAFALNVNSALGLEEPAGNDGLSLEVYPNPFRDQFHIDFTVTETSEVRLAVYDIVGRMIETIEENILGPGTYSLEWIPNGYRNGSYILQLNSNGSIVTTKVLRIE